MVSVVIRTDDTTKELGEFDVVLDAYPGVTVVAILGDAEEIGGSVVVLPESEYKSAKRYC